MSVADTPALVVKHLLAAVALAPELLVQQDLVVQGVGQHMLEG